MAMLLAVPSAAQELTITLGTAARETLAYNHRIKSRAAAVDEARAAVRQADATRLPGLSYQSSLTRGNDPVYVFGSLLRQNRFGAANFDIDKLNNPDQTVNFANTLALQLPLFTGFEIRDSKRLGETAVRQGEAVRDFTAQAELFRTMQNYLALALKTELAGIAAETEASTREELAVADRLRGRGLVLGSDYYAAQALLSSIMAAKTGFENEGGAEAAALNVLMGRPPQAKISPAPGFAAHLYSLPEEAALLSGMDAARGDIAAARLQAANATLARSMEANSILPRVGLFAQLQTNTEDFSTNPFNNLIGIGVNIPFGDFTRSARIAQKDARRTQAEQEAKALHDDAAAELARCRRQYESARAVLPQARQGVENARRSLELFKPLFRQGRQSVLEVVRAEAALMAARAALAETAFKLHSYYASIIFMSGKLDIAAADEIGAALAGEGK